MIELSFQQEGPKLGNVISIIREGLTVGMPALVMRAAQHASGELRSTVMRVFPDGRTGALARSWRETFLGREGEVVGAAAHSELVYARILDEGGTIKGKSGKLAIPFPGVKLPVGKWPRHFGKGELFRVTSKRGNEILMKKVGRDGMKPMFVLKPSVTIRGRDYIEQAAAAAQPGIEEIMAGGLARITETAGRA